MSRSFAIAFFSFVLVASQTQADNWSHWRGPTGNSVAPEATPPTEWSDTKNVKWKVPIPGRGSGSPVVWEDRVFVVTAIPVDAAAQRGASIQSNENSNLFAQQRRRPGGGGGRGRGGPLSKLRFVVMCFDRGTGALAWEQTATIATPHQGSHPTNGFASASPCTDGEHVYAHFGSRGLYCYTMDGELKWKRDDFGQMTTRNGFGEGSSPTLEGNKILVPWDQEGPSFLYALDKATGKTIWKAARDEPSCWATPLVIPYEGGKQVVMNGQNFARAYDLESGKELWRCGGQTARPVATAVAVNGLVIVGSGFQGNFMAAFRPNGRGDIEGSQNVVWTLERDTPDVASPLLSGNRLYFHKEKSAMLSCIDAVTGKPHYMASRLPGLRSTYASPVAAGGHVYLTGRSGTTVVIEDSDELKVVASNSVGETVDATPAPVDDQLFIRGEKHLFCIAAN